MIEGYFRKRYGGKKAFLSYFLGRFSCLLGIYGKHTSIDFSRVERVIFVCVGNVCRSPFAEQLVLGGVKLAGCEVVSCGIRTSGGTPAHPQAVAAALRYHIDLSKHASMSVGELGLVNSDLVVGMEPSNLASIQAIIADSGAQQSLLGLWGGTPSPYIQDPYGRCDEYFDTCYRRIKESIEGLAAGFG